MAAELNISTPEELRALIEGKSDEQINETVQQIGVDAALDRVFEGMEKAFLPEKAAGQNAVVQWDITTPEGERVYNVVFENGACKAQSGAAEKPRVSLRAAVPDFFRIITGKISGPTAFFQGKLKVGGDVLFAQTQQSWFRIPS
jgi:putative sterol carrier protein